MLQMALWPTKDEALEAAKHLIRFYVKRGDDISYLKEMGASSPNSFWVTIGGYMNGKRYSNDKILVERDMSGKIVNKIYNKQEIYNAIKEE